jgi:hypothetical protein
VENGGYFGYRTDMRILVGLLVCAATLFWIGAIYETGAQAPNIPGSLIPAPCGSNGSSGVILEAFDVPPKELWEPPLPTLPKGEGIPGGAGCLVRLVPPVGTTYESMLCIDGVTHIERLKCEDTSRFKLMSEDGKWHCLRLSP